MMDVKADVIVIGSGFGGTLTALLLHLRGFRVVLADRQRHPRFAIGESSTPIANLLLDRLATEYDLEWLRPFSRYGDWRRAHPQVMRGVKRGFAYMHHAAGHEFEPRADHRHELLVGSNPDAERADSQWMRSDFDSFLFDRAVEAGVTALPGAEVQHVDPAPSRGRGARWMVAAAQDGRVVRVSADFIVDASGAGGALRDVLGTSPSLDGIHTNSRTIYSHFTGVHRWSEILKSRGGSTSDHPFACDDATLHHVFDGGWMWVIRFDNGLTSAGFCLEPRVFPERGELAPAEEWASLLRRYPSIAAQFADARPVRPFVRTGRIQRCVSAAAGEDWAMLPTAAGFVDAFFSTGNAHTLFGVARLVEVLTATNPGADRARRLRGYDEAVRSDLRVIDRLVHGCYRSFHDMEMMSAYSMLYFLAATRSEERLRRAAAEAREPGGVGFLLADDRPFQAMVEAFHSRVCSADTVDVKRSRSGAALLRDVRDRAASYNGAGLCDPAKCNMYPYMAGD